MEVLFIRKNKTDFLSSCNSVDITVWIHHTDTNKTRREKKRVALQKNVTYSREQIL